MKNTSTQHRDDIGSYEAPQRNEPGSENIALTHILYHNML